jgi:hypothetical protein
VPAAQAIASPGRTADRAVAGSWADPVANSQLSAHDRISGTHKPQRGFSRASRTISATTCSASGGRPPRQQGCVHLRVTRRRCHRRIVPGVTR